jgi:uncharacterized protein YggT (Ycf19 family)
MLSETDSALLDEERRRASHQAVRTQIEADVNARLQSESAQLEPAESSELVGVAHELKHQAVQEAVETERELRQGRTMARLSQVVTYVFYLIYGVIGLQFYLRLVGARASNGFAQFIASLSWPLLAPFERIVETPSYGKSQLQLSYLFALFVYLLLHYAINGAFRLVAHRKVTV